MNVYYNEYDKKKCAMLKALMDDGHISKGDIDDRDIRDVKKSELAGYTQCHFFTGVGGWPLALEIAGWPADEPVWTGSAPCGPYSIVGKRKAFQDERDLWPCWFSLMGDEVPVIFGEQVADTIPLGWYDRLVDDMEARNKSVWACCLPSCATGQANEGERLFFVAAPDTPGLERHAGHETEIIERAMAAGYFTAPGVLDFVTGHDGLERPVEPGILRMVDGLQSRVYQALVEGIGDAINPFVAAAFILAYKQPD